MQIADSSETRTENFHFAAFVVVLVLITISGTNHIHFRQFSSLSGLCGRFARAELFFLQVVFHLPVLFKQHLNMSLSKRGPKGRFTISMQPAPDRPPSPSEGTENLASGFDSCALMRFEQNGADVEVCADDLEVLSQLGRGQYGYVDKVRHRRTGFVFAVKRIRSTDDKEERRRMLMDVEVNKLNNVREERSPFVVCSYGALFREGDIWICMEVMDTSLENFYKKVFELKLTIPEDVLAHIAYAIVSGLKFLKDKFGIMHRDVKPSNVLMSRNGEVKLCDFGISGKLVQSMAKTKNVGCSLYMAPERVAPTGEETPGFGVQSDVWSVGITLIEIASGKHPYSQWKNAFQQINQVVTGAPPQLPIAGGFSEDFREFIRVCCMKAYEERPKYDKLLEYDFLRHEVESPMDISPFVTSILDVSSTVLNGTAKPLEQAG